MKKAKPAKPRVVLSLHMSQETHDAVMAAAELSGETVSTFIRSAALKRAERELKRAA